MCIDYTQLNKHTIKDAFPIPFINELFDFLAHKSYLASFDLTMGYYQVPVEETSSPILAFTTPIGLFEPTRLPFGVTNGPPHFQRVISSWLKPLSDISRAFFDDCGLAALTFDDFRSSLRRFFMACRESNIKLNAEKSTIGPTKLPFIGRLIGPDSIEIDPNRLQPLRDATAPSDKTTLHSFLGLAQWFSSFIPGLSTLAHPLWTLLRKGAEWNWTLECQAAFDRVKDAILSAPILVHVCPGYPLTLRTDASTVGIGGVLLQKDPNTNTLGIVSFFGRKLLPAEMKYCTLELEALAIIYCLDRARPYIAGPILIKTDHSNLQFLRSSVNRRVQRWALILAEFDFTIQYSPGDTNFIADYLSRAYSRSPGEAMPEVNVSASRTEEAEVPLASLVRLLPHTINQEGIIILNQPPPQEILIRLWALGHDDPLSGHSGITRTTQRISSVIQWTGMDRLLRQLTSSCPLCQKLRASPGIANVMLSTRSNYPFESVFMDFIGPLRPSNGMKYILNIIDRFSRFIVLVPTPSTTAAVCANAFYNHWICSFGVPKFMTTDGGSTFTSNIMTDMTQLLSINHHISAPHHPEGHGAVERANYTVMQTVRALFRGRTQWDILVRPAAFAINTSTSRVLGVSPFAVVHGFSPRLPINHALDVDPKGTTQDDPDELAFSQKLITTAAAIYERVRAIQTNIYEKDLANLRKKSMGQTEFKIGDHVLVRYPRSDKLQLEWRGPFQITERENEIINQVSDLISKEHFRAHVNRLKNPILPV